MREFINMARVKGMYHGKDVNSISNPCKITVQRKYHNICQHVYKTFQITDARNVELRVYYNGVRQFEWNHFTLLAVGYEICIKYIDSENHRKVISNYGNTLFFSPTNACKYVLRIPNPPACKILKDKVIAEFPVIAAFYNI
ncbi:MAG: hypothetical protein PHV07_08415 [Oscillospiraceae bacterium]|jgi:hypothetical protein|nr:hypothetical protein [Oscillospiraceae bacterium]